MRPDARAARPQPSFLDEDVNGWLVTFSDLVLQLFAFVMMAAAVGSSGLGTTAGDAPAAVGEAPVVASAAPPFAPEPAVRAWPDALSRARFDDVPPPDPPPRAAASEPAPVAAVVPPAAPAAVEPADAPIPPANVAPARSLAGELEALVTAAGLGEAVQVAVAGGGVTLTISDTIGFASGRADLLPDAAPVLAAVRTLVGRRPDLEVEVAGHTDDRPIHGGVFESNLELSLARAARVARELAGGDAGLGGRVFAAGYGAQRPVAGNADSDGRARNRRVEIRLLPLARR